MKKSTILFLTFLSYTLFLTGCHKRVLIENVDHHPMPSHVENMKNDVIARSIIETAYKRGWICQKTQYNKIVCHCKRRNHQATIEILFSNHDFSINHVSTNNMKSENGKIHPKFNKWVRLLEKEIYQNLDNLNPYHS